MAVEKKAVAKVATDAVKAAPVVKEAPKAEAKKAAPKAAAKKEAAPKAAAKKEAAPKAAAKKEAAPKAAAKKEAAPKAAAKKTAAPKKAAVKAVTEISVQYAEKDYSFEKLVEIAKDVYQYDLGGKKADLKEIKLFVKPEENKVYYVLNGQEGFFNI